MNITRIVVMHTAGMDIILFHTDLPSTCPGVTDQNMVVRTECAAGTGEDYVVRNFFKSPDDVLYSNH
jgi:hypothetical protein